MIERVIGTILMLLIAAWGCCALALHEHRQPHIKSLLAALWGLLQLLCMAALWGGRWPWALAAFVLLNVVLLLWWQRLIPSNQRDWADDVARELTAQLDDDQVQLHNVRCFQWRSQNEYRVRWESRRYDLARLRGVDMIMSYWTIRPIAHVLISFGFEGGEQLAFSVEIRRVRGERFSAIGGFFKQFELSIIAADERDIVRLRTNVRGEHDYLYRLRMPRTAMRSLFLAYLEQANGLRTQARFYSTLTVNCTMLIYHMMKHILGELPMSPKVLFSGYLPQYVHHVGGLDPRYTLEELQHMGAISERARQAPDDASFSEAIRRSIPQLTAP